MSIFYACYSDAAAPPCQHAMDVGIIMDRSGSVGSKDFLKSKNFVSALARKFQISSLGTRVGIIAYHSSSHLVVKFAQEDKQNPSAMKDVIDRYHYFPLIFFLPGFYSIKEKLGILQNDYRKALASLPQF